MKSLHNDILNHIHIDIIVTSIPVLILGRVDMRSFLLSNGMTKFICCFFFVFSIITSVKCVSQKELNAQLAEAGAGKRGGGSAQAKRMNQRAAVEEWAKSLEPAKDYNATYWIQAFRKQPQNFFDFYIQKLSDVFKQKGATVNFVLVGACDGTNDRTIRDRYIPNSHWSGVFVEPMRLNIEDLKVFLKDNNLEERSTIIQAAASDKCPNATVPFKYPIYEEKKGKDKVPHWLRRQIGGIVHPGEKVKDPLWRVEDVRCITGVQVIEEWSKLTKKVNPKRAKKGGNNIKATQKKRPHILKVDAEGFDAQVLTSFLPDGIKNSELPLLINFEAKTMNERYEGVREILLKRGYAVSNFASDGFALLKAENIFNAKQRKKNKNGNTESEGEEDGEGEEE